MKLQRILSAVLSGVLLLASVPAVQADSAVFVPEGAVASVTVNNVTSYYYNNPSSGGAEAMWNTAMTGTSATVILYADWESSYGTRFGSGAGFIYDGVPNIPAGHEVTIDLNGHNINRNLEFAVEHGEVIHVASGGTLNLTDTNLEMGNIGMITGGNSTDSAGGIYIEAGAAVNMWGGNIVGNKTDVSGGGVLLAGEGSTFSMSGGKIARNTAQQCGGGVAVSDGVCKLISGEVSENIGQDGGGFYAQAGELIISGGTVSSNTAVHGGGVLLNNTAAFTLKGKAAVQNNIASGENRVGGGILAMNTVPIQLGGKPTVLNNSADGVQSNLVFWQNTQTSTDLPCYVQNAGTDLEAKIGVSLAGNLKEAVFAPDWTGSDCFICDVMDYTLVSREGSLVLKRSGGYAAMLGDKKMLLLVITLVLVALAVIAILVLAFRKPKAAGTDTEKSEQPAGKVKVKAKKKNNKKAKHHEEEDEDDADDIDEDDDDGSDDDENEDAGDDD